MLFCNEFFGIYQAMAATIRNWWTVFWVLIEIWPFLCSQASLISKITSTCLSLCAQMFACSYACAFLSLHERISDLIFNTHMWKHTNVISQRSSQCLTSPDFTMVERFRNSLCATSCSVSNYCINQWGLCRNLAIILNKTNEINANIETEKSNNIKWLECESVEVKLLTFLFSLHKQKQKRFSVCSNLTKYTCLSHAIVNGSHKCINYLIMKYSLTSSCHKRWQWLKMNIKMSCKIWNPVA